MFTSVRIALSSREKSLLSEPSVARATLPTFTRGSDVAVSLVLRYPFNSAARKPRVSEIIGAQYLLIPAGNATQKPCVLRSFDVDRIRATLSRSRHLLCATGLQRTDARPLRDYEQSRTHRRSTTMRRSRHRDLAGEWTTPMLQVIEKIGSHAVAG